MQTKVEIKETRTHADQTHEHVYQSHLCTFSCSTEQLSGKQTPVLPGQVTGTINYHVCTRMGAYTHIDTHTPGCIF